MSNKSDPFPHSTSQINKAGKTLRYQAEGRESDVEKIRAALEIATDFRAAHQYPLLKAYNGLTSMVTTSGVEANVSSRLKRFHTILDKLRREPTMSFVKMQDIGGCRAVFKTMEDLRKVEERVCSSGGRRRYTVIDKKDYIVNPADSGYRSLHIVVMYDERCIELQLRTEVQHDWAVSVEEIGGYYGFDLKSGYGPPEVLEFLGAISQAMALEEAGVVVDDVLRSKVDELRKQALDKLDRGRSNDEQ